MCRPKGFVNYRATKCMHLVFCGKLALRLTVLLYPQAMYVCMYVRMYVHMYVCMYVCTYVCTYVLNCLGSPLLLVTLRLGAQCIHYM